MNVFDAAKTVPLKDTAATVLGFSINASGTMPCPIHNEKHGKAFSVSQNKYWTCFGKCGKHGDNIEMVAFTKGVSRFEAAKEICEAFGLAYDLPKSDGTPKPEIDYSFLKGNELMTKVGMLGVMNTPEVENYLKNVRLFTDETIYNYGFGYVTRDVYDKMIVAVNDGRILKENYDAFARHVGRLVIPLYNSNGKQVLGFVSRALSKADKIKYINDNDSPHKYGYHKRVYTYGLAQSKKRSSVVIVEGYFDGPSMMQMGINTIAMGDCSLPEARFRYLIKMFTQLILGLDNDTTGVYRTMELYKKFGHINFKYVLWPRDVKDANDAIKARAELKYGDYFEYVNNVWNNNINDIQTNYENKMDFIAKLRDSLSYTNAGSENYFVRKEIDLWIEKALGD